LLFALLCALGSLGASYRTTNFQVEAPTEEIAKQVGDAAEECRREKAVKWLGKEMPAWSERCTLRVTVTSSGANGSTSFQFDKGKVLGQSMQVEGSLDRIVSGVVPHEVTHTVLAHRFKRPLPRWADEGAAVASEDLAERKRHCAMLREVLKTPDRLTPLRRLFLMAEYPADIKTMGAFYAQAQSVTTFLVDKKDESTFLAFVDQGQRDDWDKACKNHYDYPDVAALERAWLSDVKKRLNADDSEVGKDRPPSDVDAAAAKNSWRGTRADDDRTKLIATLLHATKDEDREVSQDCSEALTALGREAAPALVEALDGKDKELRLKAATILGMMGSKNAGDARDTLPALARALGDPDKEIRRAAAHAIRLIVAGSTGRGIPVPLGGASNSY
jgi:hypothetical protein